MVRTIDLFQGVGVRGAQASTEPSPRRGLFANSELDQKGPKHVSSPVSRPEIHIGPDKSPKRGASGREPDIMTPEILPKFRHVKRS